MTETTETAEKNAAETQNDDAQEKTQVQSAEFPEATGNETANAGGSIDILLNMNVSVTVALGQKEIPVRRLLQLGPGSVLELDKTIDSPVDLYLRDTKFATGDVVVTEDRFAIKIRHVIGLGDSDNKEKKKKED